MMGYQTRALPGSGMWMMESEIRNRDFSGLENSLNISAVIKESSL